MWCLPRATPDLNAGGMRRMTSARAQFAGVHRPGQQIAVASDVVGPTGFILLVSKMNSSHWRGQFQHRAQCHGNGRTGGQGTCRSSEGVTAGRTRLARTSHIEGPVCHAAEPGAAGVSSCAMGRAQVCLAGISALPVRSPEGQVARALRELVMEGVGEAEVVAACSAGRVLECGNGGTRRSVDAALLRRCCDELRDQVDRRGVRLRSAAVAGALDLSGLEVPFPLRFDDCEFDSPLSC